MLPARLLLSLALRKSASGIAPALCSVRCHSSYSVSDSEHAVEPRACSSLPTQPQAAGRLIKRPSMQDSLTQPLVPSSSAIFIHTRTLLSASRGPTKKYSQRRLVGWSVDQLFNVIANVEEYHQFVPWCLKSHVVAVHPDQSMDAELEVGFQLLRERYTSHVTLQRPHLVTSSVSKSRLFHHLENVWRMEPGPTPRSCWLTFNVEFAFCSAIYSHAADMFFSEVVKNMTGAFESRCQTLYGPSCFVRPSRT